MLNPLEIQPLDAEYAESFRETVNSGRELASGKSINVVAIARNCGPIIENTLETIDALRPYFSGGLRFYCFENDSTDGTAEALDKYAATRPNAVVEHDTLNRPDLRGWEPERVTRLAEYRNRCRDYVEKNLADAPWTIVLDMDPHGGFLPEGVLSSIHWLDDIQKSWRKSAGDSWPGGMASYSILRKADEGGEVWWAHYDAYAARPKCWWRDRKSEIGMGWFQQMILPVGAPPLPMNSAFGGLCVYRTDAYLSSRYAGGDCEHVNFHNGMAAAGYDLYINPGSVYVAVLG